RSASSPCCSESRCSPRCGGPGLPPERASDPSGREGRERNATPDILQENPAMSPQQPSFDIVSKVDDQEVKNAVQQADRELKNRFDLKGSKCEIRIEEDGLLLIADDELKLEAVDELLAQKLAKRS